MPVGFMVNSKSKILLIITPERQSTEALHWCLHKAKQADKSIEIVCVIDKEFHEKVKGVIEEVEKQCRSFNVSYETDIKLGNYLEVCESLAREKKVDVMVVTEKKPPILKKIFECSEVKKLRERVSCEIKVY